jgi:hypothetical protein
MSTTSATFGRKHLKRARVAFYSAPTFNIPRI